MDFLEDLYSNRLERTEGLPEDDFRIRGIWVCSQYFTPLPGDRPLVFRFLVCQTAGVGCCYVPHTERIEIDPSLIESDARSHHVLQRCTKIAVLDAILSVCSSKSTATYILDGNASKKSYERAEIIAFEAARLLRQKGVVKARILLIGVVSAIIGALQSLGADVMTVDLDPSVIGTQVFGVTVEDGQKVDYMLPASSLAIVTGMTLATQTTENILALAKSSGTSLLFYCETGASFATDYCRYGVDTVISEPFPFYVFHGRSEIRVFRKDGCA